MYMRRIDKKKIVSLFLAMIMVLTMVPAVAFAGENNAEDFPSSYGYDESSAESVTVYVTLSNDGVPLLGNDSEKTVMAKLKVEVPYFDLDNYGIGEYYRYKTEKGYGPYVNDTLVKRPTAMHLFIYLAERYYMGISEDKCCTGDSEVFSCFENKNMLYFDKTDAYTSSLGALNFVGSPCSLYFGGGFWGHDENLNYYRNHRYPLMSEGWGSTADYILLSDGDVIDVAMNTDWDEIFNGYFLAFNKDDYAGNPGEILSVSTMGTARTATDGGKVETGISDYTEEIEITLYNEDWQPVDTTIEYKEDGIYNITLPEVAGEYYILGTSYSARTNFGVDAPAVASVVVDNEVAPEPEPEQPQGPTGDELKAEAIKKATVSATAKAASYAKVKVSWNKIKDADKYEVYRSTSKNGKYTRITTTGSTSVYNTKSVKTGRTYYYKVRAKAEIAGETVYSKFSSVKSAKPVLAKVTGVKAKAGKKKITVSWKKPAGANGYKVYRYNASTGKYKVVKTVTKGSTVKWTNTKLKKGKTYKYKIKAYRNVDGKKVYSPSYSAVVKAKVK